jgi:hypothetical protein
MKTKIDFGLRFIDKIIKSTLIAAAVLFPFLVLYFGTSFGLSVLLGAVWGSLNLLAIKIVITSLVTARSRKVKLGIMILIVKLPVLYGLGYFLVTSDYLSAGGLLWGFSGILITAFLNALSRMALGLDGEVKTGGSGI